MRLAIPAIMWAVIWGTAWHLWDQSGGGKNAESWAFGIPFFLPAGMVIWGMLGGVIRAGARGAIVGAAIYCVLDLIGFVMLCVFQGGDAIRGAPIGAFLGLAGASLEKEFVERKGRKWDEMW
jgi:hypothetical protein